MREYIINGNKFRGENSFYNLVEKLFIRGLSYKTGRSLDAFEDILFGGFGMHETDEKIIVKWINFKKSEERLKPDFLECIVDIIESNERVYFYKYPYREN